MGLNARIGRDNPIFISSWKSFRNFMDATAKLGSDKFPMITEQLPDGDEGFTSADKVQTLLDELMRFIEEQTHIQQAVLVDSERNIDISMGSNILRGALTTDRLTGYDLGFNEKGFFVRDRWELDRILFQAMRVEQRLINPEHHQVEYHDRDSDRHFFCTTPFGKVSTGADGVPRMMLQYFHIELRNTAPNRFAYITDPLLRVFESALEKNEGIEWI
ncbi:MAG: hypothetical protein Phog2KO_38620 [Phototrophicaceae bacterium]